jgi:PAS domain S-box-containing protein
MSEAAPKHALPGPLRFLALGTGASLILLGLIAALGWLLHIPALVQFLHPWADLMVPNAASALLIVGLALALAGGRRRPFEGLAVSGAAGIAVFSLSTVALFGYFFGIRPAFGGEGVIAMSPQTAVGLALVTSLLPWSVLKASQSRLGHRAQERSQAETLIKDQFIREVAERRVAEQERDKFFSLSIDMLCISNGDGYFKRLNPAFERTLGYTVEELTDRPFLDFVHPEDAAVTLAEVDKQLSGGVPVLHFENRYRCKDGTYRWLAWTSMPDVETGMMYALARDVTARKSLEAEREGLILELQTTLAQVRTLSSLLPMCSSCRRIRDDGDGTWSQLELYLSKTHSGTQVSHGICPECMGQLYPDQARRIEARKRREKA